jgi:putative endonuclease
MKLNRHFINYLVGLVAEYIAVILLKFKFYNIIARRFKCSFGEIDIIAIKGKTIVFIEVKKRLSHHSETITLKQKNRIISAASFFLAKHPFFENYDCRVDLIQLNKSLLPKHFINHINW